MKKLKLFIILTALWGAMYSCSHKGTRPLYLNYIGDSKSVPKNKIVSPDLDKSGDTNLKTDKQVIIDVVPKVVATDNQAILNKINGKLDSIYLANQQLHSITYDLLNSNFLNINKALSIQEKLLLEEKARREVEREKETLLEVNRLRDSYIFAIIIIGIFINIIIQLVLYVIREKQIKKYKLAPDA